MRLPLSPPTSLLATRSLLLLQDNDDDQQQENARVAWEYNSATATVAAAAVDSVDDFMENNNSNVVDSLRADDVEEFRLPIGSLKRSLRELTRGRNGNVGATEEVIVPVKKVKLPRSYTIEPADINTDPATWTVQEVFEHVSREANIAHHATWLRNEKVDGRALLLLNLSTLMKHLKLPHKALLPLAHHLCKLKMAHLLSRET